MSDDDLRMRDPARFIAEALGCFDEPDVNGNFLVPCPAHPPDIHPSLSIKNGDNGRLVVNCFAGCRASSVFARFHRLGLAPPLEELDDFNGSSAAVAPKSEIKAESAAPVEPTAAKPTEGGAAAVGDHDDDEPDVPGAAADSGTAADSGATSSAGPRPDPAPDPGAPAPDPVDPDPIAIAKKEREAAKAKEHAEAAAYFVAKTWNHLDPKSALDVKVDAHLDWRGLRRFETAPPWMRFQQVGRYTKKDKVAGEIEYFFRTIYILAENPETREITGAQREYIATDGKGYAPGLSKSERKKTTPKCSIVKSICRMGEPVPGWPYLVGEGWTSVRTGQDATNLPGCSVFGLSGLANFVAPPGVDWVIVLAENDEKGQNAEALKKLVPRLIEKGLKVGVAQPPPGLNDINELVRERADKTRVHGTAEAGRKIVADLINKAARESRRKDDPAASTASPLPGVDDGDDEDTKFSMADSGLFKGKMFVCQPFEVVGRVRSMGDGKTTDWGLLLRFANPDRHEVESVIPAKALHGDASLVASLLADDGMRIRAVPAARKALVEYLGSVPVKNRIVVVKRTGWASVNGLPVFVLPHQTIGTGSERVVLAGEGRTVVYAKSGTLEEWKDRIGRPAGQHLLLQFAIAVALAPTLLRMSGGESGGFHFYEFSTRGKTTSQQVAASCHGSGALNGGYIRRWRATANSLEATFASASDTILVLDEISQLGFGELATVIYTVTGEVGKGRLRADATSRIPYSWRTLVFSSGEVPISSRIDEDRYHRGGRSRELRGGATVRVIDIPVDRAHGVFDQPKDTPDFNPAAFAETLQEAASTCYGHAGPAFIQALIDEKVDGAAVKLAVSNFVTSVLGGVASDDGQLRRVARRFGLVAVAGVMAVGAEIVDWDAEAFTEGVRGLFRAWAKARGGDGAIEEVQILGQARLFFERYGESRFDDADPVDVRHDRPVGERAGYKSDESDGRRWYVFPQVWGEIFPGLASKAAKILCERGILERGTEKDRLTKKVQIGDLKRQSFYVVNQRIFEGWGEPDES